jgi:hypothetical protein
VAHYLSPSSSKVVFSSSLFLGGQTSSSSSPSPTHPDPSEATVMAEQEILSSLVKRLEAVASRLESLAPGSSTSAGKIEISIDKQPRPYVDHCTNTTHTKMYFLLLCPNDFGIYTLCCCEILQP